MSRSRSSSSSEEEDGDEEWKAAINSVAFSYKPNPKANANAPISDEEPFVAPPPKHYQLKVQKTLDDILERSLLMVNHSFPSPHFDDSPLPNGVRLFKHAPPGIVFDYQVEVQGPSKKPTLIPGEVVHEQSNKFKKRIRSVAVEGTDIIAAAEIASQKAKARLEAREAAAKEAAKREEDRVAELKKIRGERWLPSMAKHMQQLQRPNLKTGTSK
ncbi:hypothetical protein vseg_005263 [Gypsophila vaccaria]